MRFDGKTMLRVVGVAVPIVFGLILGRALAPWLPQFAAWVHTMGTWAPAAFVAVYIVVVLCMLPAFLLTMVGGAVFGVAKGAALVMTGAMIGATGAFLIGRYLAREQVSRRVAKNPALASIDGAIGENGMKLVFLIRLSPLFPFVLTNYALGVTRVRLRDFVIGTLGLAPIVVAYAALGSASGSVANADGRSSVSPLVVGAGIVATVILCVVLARITQRAIRDAKAITP